MTHTPSNKLSERARKNLCLGAPVAPRVRAENEAIPIQVHAATAARGYVPGDGDVFQPMRDGSQKLFGSRGLPT